MTSESLLEAEIRAQPEALDRLLTTHVGTARELSLLLRQEDVRFVLVAARGSSSNAARYAQYVLGRAHRVPVALATPSLYTIYGQPPRLDGALVVGISQSGGSPDVVAVLEEARRQGRPTIALTNTPDSPLAQVASSVLPLEAGVEHAVAATKTYSNSIAAIALLFCVLTGDDAALSQLRAMPERVDAQIALTLSEAAPTFNGLATATVVGRGVNYSTAREVALKIRELSGSFVEAYSAAELLHGPVAALTAGSPVIGVAAPGPAFATVVETLAELRRRGALTIAISEPTLTAFDAVLPLVPRVPEWLSPLTAVVPGQVLGMRIGASMGRDVDSPAGLQKVTLTR
jgi:glucosamine--fructose-6-phosphate aminotransferase (isomerizing)